MAKPPKRSFPTADYLHERFIYDAAKGALIWKTRPRHHFKTNRGHAIWNARYAGKEAGTNRAGYIATIINNDFRTAVHRVIWAMHTGEWVKEIDHINGDKTDNRFQNLRAVSRQQNNWNTPSRKWRDLPRGVSKANQKSGFVAGVTINGKRVHLGTFATPEEAHAAWLAATREERGEFFRAD